MAQQDELRFCRGLRNALGIMIAAYAATSLLILLLLWLVI